MLEWRLERFATHLIRKTFKTEIMNISKNFLSNSLHSERAPPMITHAVYIIYRSSMGCYIDCSPDQCIMADKKS